MRPVERKLLDRGEWVISGMTFLDFPPMQRGASFNLDALKAELQQKMIEALDAAKGTGD